MKGRLLKTCNKPNDDGSSGAYISSWYRNCRNYQQTHCVLCGFIVRKGLSRTPAPFQVTTASTYLSSQEHANKNTLLTTFH